MDDQLKSAIKSVYDADPSAFKSSIFDVLSAKVADRLQTAKTEYAASVFGQTPNTADDEDEYEEDSIGTEETTDEEV